MNIIPEALALRSTKLSNMRTTMLFELLEAIKKQVAKSPLSQNKRIKDEQHTEKTISTKSGS